MPIYCRCVRLVVPSLEAHSGLESVIHGHRNINVPLVQQSTAVIYYCMAVWIRQQETPYLSEAGPRNLNVTPSSSNLEHRLLYKIYCSAPR